MNLSQCMAPGNSESGVLEASLELPASSKCERAISFSNAEGWQLRYSGAETDSSSCILLTVRRVVLSVEERPRVVSFSW